MRLHHTDDPICPLCEHKLEGAHPDLAEWYRGVKARHPDAHISWAFRGKADQNRFFADGASKAPWPLSKHNHEKDGKPCSLALDLFQIRDGRAIFDPVFGAKVNAENQAAGLKLVWGGTFKRLGDAGHFEMAT